MRWGTLKTRRGEDSPTTEALSMQAEELGLDGHHTPT